MFNNVKKEKEEIKRIANVLMDYFKANYDCGDKNNLAYRYPVFTLKILYRLIWNPAVTFKKRNLYFWLLYRILRYFQRKVVIMEDRYSKYLNNMSSSIYTFILGLENVMINGEEPLYQEAAKLYNEDVDFINRLKEDMEKIYSLPDDYYCWLKDYISINGNARIMSDIPIKLTNMILRLYLGERYQNELGVMWNIRKSCKSTDEQIQNEHNPSISLHEFKKVLYNTYNMHHQQLMDRINNEEIAMYDTGDIIKDTLIDMINTNSFVDDTGMLPVAGLSMYKFEETPYGRTIKFNHFYIGTMHNLLFK